VLIEGFKDSGFPKLAVRRAEVGKPNLWPEWQGIVAIASDSPPPDTDIARLSLSDTAAVAAFVLSNAAGR
jgi:molybdopterin-guanine dinucleotide biosynthesis protein